MDITETLRQESIPKTDFFEFIQTSETSDPVGQQYARTMKAASIRTTLGLFMETPGGVNSTEDGKETNNNHLLMNAVDLAGGYVDNSFWTTAETNMLDELNCWTPSANVHGSKSDNTDGAIYTLTVLNGAEQPPGSWYKHEEKDEKLTHHSHHHHHPHPPSSLDLDSLLNIIPPHFPNNFHPDEKGSEFNYSGESGGGGGKEGGGMVAEIVLPGGSPNGGGGGGGGFNSGGSGSNGSGASGEGGSVVEVDSLLRSALQGKGFGRYNGIKVEKEEAKKTGGEEEKLMTLEAPHPLTLYESPTTALIDSDNPSSAQSVDDMFLSQLDVSYPEDYEKLKRIESEVAESVEQYCLERGYLPAVDRGSPMPPAVVVDPILNTIQTKPSKKYTKRSKSQVSAAGSSSSGVRKERSLHYCNICSKGFKDKYSVNVHIRTHTGEKPFTCSLCGKSFRQKAHLAKHYQTHMAQAKNGVTSNQKAAKNLIPTS